MKKQDIPKGVKQWHNLSVCLVIVLVLAVAAYLVIVSAKWVMSEKQMTCEDKVSYETWINGYRYTNTEKVCTIIPNAKDSVGLIIIKAIAIFCFTGILIIITGMGADYLNRFIWK